MCHSVSYATRSVHGNLTSLLRGGLPLVLIVGVMGAAAGCDGQVSAEALSEEETGTIRSMLCTDGVADATIDAAAAVANRRASTTNVVTSPLPTGGYSRDRCEARFVVDITGLHKAAGATARRYTPTVSTPLPRTVDEYVCRRYFVQVKLFTQSTFMTCLPRLPGSPPICSPAPWKQRGDEVLMQGRVVYGPWTSRYCELSPVDPAKGLPELSTGDPIQALRVAVSAYSMPLVTPIYQEASVSIRLIDYDIP